MSISPGQIYEAGFDVNSSASARRLCNVMETQHTVRLAFTDGYSLFVPEEGAKAHTRR